MFLGPAEVVVQMIGHWRLLQVVASAALLVQSTLFHNRKQRPLCHELHQTCLRNRREHVFL